MSIRDRCKKIIATLIPNSLVRFKVLNDGDSLPALFWIKALQKRGYNIQVTVDEDYISIKNSSKRYAVKIEISDEEQELGEEVIANRYYYLDSMDKYYTEDEYSIVVQYEQLLQDLIDEDHL